MKKLLQSLILLFSLTCFSQYDSISVVDNKKVTKSYKLMNNGKWEKFARTDDYFVSHCETFKDEKNTFLEYRKLDPNKIVFTNGSKLNLKSLKELDLEFLDYLNKNDIEIVAKVIGPEKNYYLYKLKKKSKLKPDEKILINYLLGVKNKFEYRFALYNYDLEIENSFDFLANLFNQK